MINSLIDLRLLAVVLSVGLTACSSASRQPDWVDTPGQRLPGGGHTCRPWAVQMTATPPVIAR